MATYLWRSGPATGPGTDAVAATTQAVAGAAQDGMADAADSGLHFADFLQAVLKFSGLFSYLTSRWSLACFTMVWFLPDNYPWPSGRCGARC